MTTPIRILLVEDSTTDAKLLLRELQNLGRPIEHRRVEDEELMNAALADETWDLILSDWTLPRFSGLRALATLRATGHDIPFIICSGTVGEETAVEALRAGAHDFVLKTRLARLNPAVNRELAERDGRALARKAERALRASELRYRRIVETTNQGVMLIDAEGKVSLANQRMADLLGFTVDELDGRPVVELLAESERPQAAAQLARHRFGERDPTELPFLRRDGSLLTGLVQSSILFDEQSQFEHILAMVTDITERNRISESLRLFRELVDRSSDAFEIIDLETGRFLDVNERDCAELGYTREDFLRLSVWDIDPTVERSQWPDVVARLRAVGTIQGEGIHRRRDGSTFPVEFSVKLVDVDRMYAVAVVRDITERRASELALRTSEERFRQMAESIDEVFWMTDLDNDQMLYVSPAYQKIWGRTCESLVENPRTWLDAIHAEDRPRVIEALAKQARGDYDETYRITRPDGSVRWIHDRGFPVRDAGGRVTRVVGIAEDVSVARRLEDQFRQAQKMEAIGTLAGGIAHDFNNILSAVIGYTELAKARVTSDPIVGKYLDTVLQGGTRAVALVRQILAFSRQQEQQRTPVQLREVVMEPLRLLRATIPSTIEFDLSLADDLPAILADGTRIHQLVMNLCTNAAHAMRDRPGRLRVSLERLVVDDPLARAIPGLRLGPYVRLSVRDTGHGMDQATLDRLFEPFFTTKAPGEGTGLGLSVVHGIVKGHDGAVTVDSTVGEGTTFHVYFPAIVDAALGAAASADSTPRGQGERILFVDDEAPLAELGRTVLAELGYVVDTRTDPTQALAAIESDPPSFDLVVTDHTMPGMTGLDLARAIRGVRADLPILIATGNVGGLGPERLREVGAWGVLPKPFTRHTLATEVRRALASQQGR